MLKSQRHKMNPYNKYLYCIIYKKYMTHIDLYKLYDIFLCSVYIRQCCANYVECKGNVA